MQPRMGAYMAQRPLGRLGAYMSPGTVLSPILSRQMAGYGGFGGFDFQGSDGSLM